MPERRHGPERGPRPDARQALLQQLRYLIVEVDALRPLLEDLPDAALRSPRPDNPSIIETLAQLASRDRLEHLPLLQDRRSSSAHAPAGTDERVDGSIGKVLDELRAARTKLVEAFEELPPAGWSEPLPAEESDEAVADLALRIVQQDAAVLRGAAEWLRGALFVDRQPGGRG